MLPANAWGCLPSAKRLQANVWGFAASQCLFAKTVGQWQSGKAAVCLRPIALPSWATRRLPLCIRQEAKRPIALPSWATRRRHPAHSPAGELLGGGAVAVLKPSLVRADTQRPLPLPRAPPVGLENSPASPQQPFSSSLSAAFQQRQQPFQPFCLPACLVSCARASCKSHQAP